LLSLAKTSFYIPTNLRGGKVKKKKERKGGRVVEFVDWPLAKKIQSQRKIIESR
jgi:hypothetical protein